MDNLNWPNIPSSSRFSKLLTRRNIFIALGVIIALEVVWAGWFLIKSGQEDTTRSLVADKTEVQPTSITLTSERSEYRVGDEIAVSVNISSSKKVDGADLIISFDPKVLTAKEATLGSIFSDYPQNRVDNTLGRVAVSGITSQAGGVIPQGEFGKLNFTAKAAGTTTVAFDFTPGLTGDTNVSQTATSKDILEKVNQLELNILP